MGELRPGRSEHGTCVLLHPQTYSEQTTTGIDLRTPRIRLKGGSHLAGFYQTLNKKGRPCPCRATEQTRGDGEVVVLCHWGVPGSMLTREFEFDCNANHLSLQCAQVILRNHSFCWRVLSQQRDGTCRDRSLSVETGHSGHRWPEEIQST